MSEIRRMQTHLDGAPGFAGWTELHVKPSVSCLPGMPAEQQNTSVLARSRIVLLLTLVAITVTGGSYLLRHTYAAVLDSVRFSALVFAFALAARARGSSLYDKQRELTISFAWAHYVHFAAVAWLVYSHADHPAHSVRGLVTMSGGFTLITLLLVATMQGWEKLGAFAFYLSGFFLLAAFGRHATDRPISAAMVLILLSAFAYRVAKGRTTMHQAAAS